MDPLTLGEGVRLTGLGAVALLLTIAQPASASTSGHLRGPFSIESQQRERANFAAEERSVRRAPEFRQSPSARYRREGYRY